MPTNPYFGSFQEQSEQNLHDELVIESIQMHGDDFSYIQREVVNEDDLFNEDTISKFSKTNIIEMYIETIDGWEGEQDIMSKFGIEIKDSATLVVSKTRFKNTIKGIGHPREGDLIFFPLTNSLFEIKFVEHESPFYQLGKNYTYRLSVELYKFSREDFETGVEELDDMFEYEYPEEHTDIDPFADNDEIQEDADEVEVFDPNNPFGGL